MDRRGETAEGAASHLEAAVTVRRRRWHWGGCDAAAPHVAAPIRLLEKQKQPRD